MPEPCIALNHSCNVRFGGMQCPFEVYQLTVFLSNLGYVLRLQMAVRDWLLETMVFNPNCDLHSFPTDPLMEEVRDYIKMWHHSKKHEEIEDGGNPRVKQCDRRMEAFVGMWNGSPTGAPTHHCNCHLAGEGHRHCKDRQHAAEKMANVLIDLLLTSCPSPPAPNKWTKLWRPVDFVAVGILLNGYLPKFLTSPSKQCSFQPLATAGMKIQGLLRNCIFTKCRGNGT